MSAFHDPLVVLALLVCLLVGWFANELWDQITYHVRAASEEAQGWLHDAVYSLGWITVVGALTGLLGLWQGWWG
jgi:hypothetical protein